MRSLLPLQRVEIKLTELGAPRDPDLGDIDVLAWDQETDSVFLIECKRLKTALTVRQAVQQLEEFRGDLDQGGKDSMAKHQRRIEWLKANPQELSKITGILAAKIRWIPLLVTSGRVPMSFLDAIGFPKERVVPEQELERFIAEYLAQARHPDLSETDSK
jgi:hypothetical protein